MRKLFINEWMKMKYSPLLWALSGGILAFVLFFGAAPSGVMRPLDSGIPASFGYMSSCGTVIMIFLSPIVGIFFTRELQQGTMHNTLSCGVGRGQYFVVKAICVVVSGLSVYLVSVLEYTVLRILRDGFWPASAEIPDCGFAAVLLFQLGCCVQQVTYISFFLLIAVLAKRTAIVNLAGIVIWFAEAALALSASWYRGPVASILSSYELWMEGKVLTGEFLELYMQCVIMSAVFLIFSYLIFRKRDIQ